ncbi:MAG: hypothetical protein WAV82_00620 [Methylobacter sp.]
MITAAFHIGIYTIVFFIVGMIKPKWALFFLKKPDRFLILIISTVFFMISATLFGEGNRQKLEEAKQVTTQSPAPVSAPVPIPETPATK